MASAEQRRRELERLMKRDGCVRPSVVVKESAPKKAPLHDEFEWDDKVAAHEHRLAQARRLIRTTIIRDSAGVESHFVHVPISKCDSPTAAIAPDREGVYKPMVQVVRDPDDYEKALRQLIAQRNAMDATIRELQRAAKKNRKQPDLLPQLIDALDVAKRTLHLMAHAA